VGEIRDISLFQIWDEIGGVIFVLDEPATPEVADALLVARGAGDGKGVEVDCSFDYVCWGGLFRINEDGVAF